MGLFSSRKNNTVSSDPAGTHANNGKLNGRETGNGVVNQSHPRGRHNATGGAFSAGLWLRLHGVDLITMACMGVVGLGVYEAPPAPSRSFPVYAVDGTVVYPQFAYPLRREIVPIWLAAILAFIVPWVFFTMFQIRLRSLNSYLTTIMGLLKSLITAAVFQVFLKWLIGGLRPHFLDVCKPNVPTSGAQSGIGFGQIMYDRTICTGDKKEINDSLESFPSGHSTAAFAGFIYLALYFNGQLKVMSAHNPAFWKMILFFSPILGATLIAGALTIDEFHNWYDVMFGAAIGTCTSIVAYRQTFASVLDFRFNHILLPRTSSLFHRPSNTMSHGGLRENFYSYNGMGLDGLDNNNHPVTSEGGWGVTNQEAFVGAPGDATVLLNRGSGGIGVGSGNDTSGVGNMETGKLGAIERREEYSTMDQRGDYVENTDLRGVDGNSGSNRTPAQY